MADNVTPMKKVNLDLDSFSREDIPEPFVVKVGGELVEFNDPFELDYTILDRIDNPETFAKYCVSDDSRAHFKKQALPVWKFRELSKAYMEHYKVDELLGN
jgi:hypothetical protein